MRSILITGGTGSFGRAFVRRLLLIWEAERVIVFSRGEHAQAAMAAELYERYRSSADTIRFFIGDVRDRDRLRRAFEGVDVVVHAAALKRIEVGHYNPAEMVKTNIIGAMNVIEAAGVRKVVALSTDKAWQPISPYGQSKALAEMLFLNANNTTGESGPRFAVTRYGNVWNSAGSVVPTWRALLAAGAPHVPISDPDCTRFFMTMDEAIDLVIDTIKTMKGGEFVIPTLPAYRLGDLALAMGVEMDVRGLPTYEKLHEGMADGNTSDKARRLSVDDLREALAA